MRSFYVTAFLLLFSVLLTAQNKNSISGSVLHAVTGDPVAGASVFINGTSKGTVTNSTGQFYLNDVPKGSYELVFSSVGFTTVVYTFSADKLPLELKISLQPKVMELEAVTVAPFVKNGWKEWGKFFTDNFIGTSAVAKDCEIKNHKVLRFKYSKKNQLLEVVAEKPLIIENRALGYRIQYQLEAFVYDGVANTQVFLGFSWFEDMAKDRNRIPQEWVNNRRQAYQGSLMHFIRSLYANKLLEEGFEVQRMIRDPNLEKQRVRKLRTTAMRRMTNSGEKIYMAPSGTTSYDSLKHYQLVMLEPDSIDIVSPALLNADSLISVTSDSTKLFFFPNYLRITQTNVREQPEYLTYTKQVRKPWYQRSVIRLIDALPVTIDPNGLYYPPQELFMTDYWGWSEKVGQLLPWDYK